VHVCVRVGVHVCPSAWFSESSFISLTVLVKTHTLQGVFALYH